MKDFLSIAPARQIPIEAVPMFPVEEFRERVIAATRNGMRLIALPGRRTEAGSVRVLAVLASDKAGALFLGETEMDGEYAALTRDRPFAQAFERELAEEWGLRPLGHPWLKPLRFPCGRPGVTDFLVVQGEGIHEISVGPVHAGIIEPGHFRFQCAGENVVHLEIALGYQHRGVEQSICKAPAQRRVCYFETLAGDTTIGHTTAYAQAMEALSDAPAPPRAEALRAIALELERLANHTGDLGALANDVGFLPTASYCGRLRGDFLNMTALICGSRFGRGLVRPGGVCFDLEPSRSDELRRRLDEVEKDARSAVELLWSTPTVMARFEGVGVVSTDVARTLGLVGPAARAAGLDQDARRDFPSGWYRFHHIPTATWSTGDVFGRAFVRWLEIQRSLAFLRETLSALPAGESNRPPKALLPQRLTVTMTESWRGETVHVAMTDEHGALALYKVVDPSFRNWMGLAVAMRGQQISDFPLCNKSFNLSYCGHDL